MSKMSSPLKNQRGIWRRPSPTCRASSGTRVLANSPSSRTLTFAVAVAPQARLLASTYDFIRP
jgi:hypothetical protein